MGFGIYKISQAKEDKHSSQADEFNDIATAWDEDKQPAFTDLNVTLHSNGLEPCGALFLL